MKLFPPAQVLMLCAVILCTPTEIMSQTKSDPFLKSILLSGADTIVQQVLDKPQEFRPQIIYTRIDRDKQNRPTFTNLYFNYNPDQYFNPASMVKLPAAFLALEKLHRRQIPGVNKYTTILHDSTFQRQTTAYTDSTSETGLPSIAHYIRRAFLISENDPYNRLYQFLGQEHFNFELHKKGYLNTRITRQFMGFTDEQNRHTNGIRFVDEHGQMIHQQAPGYNQARFHFPREIKLGNAYMGGGKLVNEPFNFTEHNNQPLEDYRLMLQSLLFPGSVQAHQRFDLSNDDRQFLLQYLSQYPSETNYPKYDGKEFYDSYVKFFFRDETRLMPSHVRVFNKVGWAYGFLTDVSYVIDTLNQIEYMLSATVYTNRDGVLNDGKYEYDEVGYPFLRAIGKAVYNHELNRSRRYKPDLAEFRLNYEKRDPKDTRPVISEADN